MAGIDELSRVIGNLESSIQTLFHKQDILCIEVKNLSSILQKRTVWNSAKVVAGGFAGGFAAMVTKIVIWGGK